MSMGTFYVAYVPGTTTYSVSVVLDGSSFLPVTASVGVSQRKLTTKGTVRNGVVVYQVLPSVRLTHSSRSRCSEALACC